MKVKLTNVQSRKLIELVEGEIQALNKHYFKNGKYEPETVREDVEDYEEMIEALKG
ncbi:hypothetical protein [Bacillus sp. JCM 19041]|uniref:hypothetical protein n=1 Tax=Bacillus sp. JCM 19041 TaxID=1460637 RepID=UPI000ACD667D